MPTFKEVYELAKVEKIGVHGDTRPLAAYLRDPDNELSWNQRNLLAKLVLAVRRRGPGERGQTKLTGEAAEIRRFAGKVLHRKLQYRDERRVKRVSADALDLMMQDTFNEGGWPESWQNETRRAEVFESVKKLLEKNSGWIEVRELRPRPPPSYD